VKYRTIVADPPWHYDSFVRGAGAGGSVVTVPMPYPSMTLGELADLPVREWAMPDAFLFMWTTNRYLPESFWIANAWGFEYRQLIVWDKGTSMSPFGGSVCSNRAEFLLVCRRGQPRIKERWPDGSVVHANRGEHSAKPEVFLDLVEMVAPGPYLEMFARRQRLGWDTWGNQAMDHIAETSNG
jgi:N6-adenosine-specific RNA methylase IME4